MDNIQIVLQAMRKAAQPVTQKEVEVLTGLSSKEVDQAFKLLKKEAKIVSPIRCKWQPK